MKIPKYVQEILSRSKYEYDLYTKHENYSAGYTIRIYKHSEYAYAETFQKEVMRLCSWVNKVAGTETAHVLYSPTKTHHCKQYAIISIFDPVMQKIEKYIPQRN